MRSQLDERKAEENNWDNSMSKSVIEAFEKMSNSFEIQNTNENKEDDSVEGLKAKIAKLEK